MSGSGIDTALVVITSARETVETSPNHGTLIYAVKMPSSLNLTKTV